ncbi:hypothetical protein BWI17_06830 [Betaproteobacteria bacterium GR16-43]|nr:hypothetical protein BWI17_06830 [Betaproteobacteria bacterium GR16-43]
MIRLAGSGFALLCLLGSVDALSDVVQTKERTYAVKFKDDAVERYNVKWTLDFTANVREAGGTPPVPYQGASNAKACSWKIEASANRAVFLVTRLGQPFSLPKMDKVLDLDPRNPGKPYTLAGQRDLTCNDVKAERAEELANAKATVLKAFETQAADDLARLVKEAQANAEVASVSVLP